MSNRIIAGLVATVIVLGVANHNPNDPMWQKYDAKHNQAAEVKK